LQSLVGEELASVTFVCDYLQLGFGGPTLTCLGRRKIIGPIDEIPDGQPAFEHAARRLIGEPSRNWLLKVTTCSS